MTERKPREPGKKDFTFNGVDYPAEIAHIQIKAAILKLSAGLGPDEGVNTSVLIEELGAFDKDTRHRIAQLLQNWSKAPPGESRPAVVEKIGRGQWLLTGSGRLLGMNPADERVYELRSFIRQDGGISTGKRIRARMGLRGRRAIDRDTSEWRQLEFAPYAKVLQTHDRISRVYRDDLGKDGLFALVPDELNSCVLSGYSHWVLVSSGLMALGDPTYDEVVDAYTAEAMRIGEAMARLREHLKLAPWQMVMQPGVLEALDLTYDTRVDSVDNISIGDEKSLRGDQRLEQLQSLKVDQTSDGRHSALVEQRLELSRHGVDPKLAGAVLKLQWIEAGDDLIFKAVPPSLFVAIAGEKVCPMALSRGYIWANPGSPLS